MKSVHLFKGIGAKVVVGTLLLALTTESAWAIFGVWRRTAFRTAAVAGTVATTEAATAAAATTAAATSATAANEAAAASAQQSAAAAAASAQQAAAANPPPSAQQKLKELQSLYDQGLITSSEYQASKQKILNELTQ